MRCGNLWRITDGSEDSGSLQLSLEAFLWGHIQGSTPCLYWHPKYEKERKSAFIQQPQRLKPGKFNQGLYRFMFSHKFLFLIAQILLEKGAAKTNYMQSNLLQSSWWHMSQSWRKLNQYVYVVNTVNHRAVAHTWLFHIFWTVACGVIMKDSIKKQQEKNDPLHFWTHTQQAT